MNTNSGINRFAALGLTAVGVATLAACGGTSPSVSADDSDLTVDALDAMFDLDSGGAFCTSYRSAVRFVGGDEVADIVVDLAVEYAEERGHDITAFSTDVIVAYVERECAGASTNQQSAPVTASSDEDASQPGPASTPQGQAPADGESASSPTDHTSLSEIVGPDVAGFVGPLVLPDGSQVAVVARTGDSMAMTGTVELVVDHGGSWRVDQTLDVGFPGAPMMVGDLTGDGLTEIVITMIGSTGGKSWDVIYRINPDGPTLEEIPFAVNELEPLIGSLPFGLTVYTVQPDTVSTSVVTCDPSCADDPGTPVEWYLDRSGSWILRPQMSQPEGGGAAVGDAVDVHIEVSYTKWDPDAGDGVFFADCLNDELWGRSPGNFVSVTDSKNQENARIFTADPWVPFTEDDTCVFETSTLTVDLTDGYYTIGNDLIGYTTVSPNGLVYSAGRPELFVFIEVDLDSNKIRDSQTYDGNAEDCGC